MNSTTHHLIIAVLAVSTFVSFVGFAWYAIKFRKANLRLRHNREAGRMYTLQLVAQRRGRVMRAWRAALIVLAFVLGAALAVDEFVHH